MPLTLTLQPGEVVHATVLARNSHGAMRPPKNPIAATSDDTNVATVAVAGNHLLITGVGGGTATITLTESTNKGQISASVFVEVNDDDVALEVSEDESAPTPVTPDPAPAAPPAS